MFSSISVVLILATFLYAQIPQNGLIAYYPFSGNANDASENANDGILNGNPVLSNDRFGNLNQAYSFDGDDYITIEDDPLLNLTTCWAFCAWYYVTETVDGYHTIISRGEDVIQDVHQDWIRFDAISNRFQHIYEFQDNIGPNISSDMQYPVRNQWYFIVSTRSEEDMYKMYVNGIEVSSIIYDNPAGSINAPVYIGAIFNNPVGLVCYAKGLIDDIRIYNRYLSADEVMELYCENGWCNVPPVAQSHDVMVSAGNECEINVSADQINYGSYDPDGDPITLALTPQGPYSLGITEVQLIVTDDKGASDSTEASITVTGGSGMVIGTAWVNDTGIVSLIVKLLDSMEPTTVISSTTTDVNGEYAFENVPLGEYQVMIVEPLGYSVANNFILTTVYCGQISIVDFNLTEQIVTNNARGKGYWKHQFDVQVNHKGQAHESAEQLQTYITEIHRRYTPYFKIFEGINTFEDWQNILSVKGNAGMEAKALSQLAALVLNLMSMKLAQYEIVSEDDYSAGAVLTYVSELLPEADLDPANDELAKDLAEQVNEHQIIAPDLIHPSRNVLYKIAGDYTVNEISFTPAKFDLYQNWPNPFNPLTTITFDLPQAAWVKIRLYDIQGRLIRVLLNEYRSAGHYSIQLHAMNLASGTYYYRMESNGFLKVMRLIIAK
jgi:hypothetical protein